MLTARTKQGIVSSEMDLESFRAVVQATLRTRAWSLNQLGRESGIQPSVISRWLNPPQGALKPSRPTPKNLEKLAPVLGVPYEDLMRMCGYLPGEINADSDRDPVLAFVIAGWPGFSRTVREAVAILVGVGGRVTGPTKPRINSRRASEQFVERDGVDGLEAAIPTRYHPIGSPITAAPVHRLAA